MKKITALLIVSILLIGAIPVRAKIQREVWIPSPGITCGVTEEEIMVNKAIQMGVTRLYRLDSIGEKHYLAVLEEKFSNGGTNANREHSNLEYYSLLETEDSFIILGEGSAYNEYDQDALEEVIDISADIDIAFYEEQGCEAPIYIVNPNEKYTCADWEESDDYVFIGHNGGLVDMTDINTSATARYPFVFENKFYTGKDRYISDDRGYYYYLSDGKTKATVKNLCGIKSGSLVDLTSTKVETANVTAENGYAIYRDGNYTGNVKHEQHYLISGKNNLYVSYQSYLNDATDFYDYKITINEIINGNVTPVNEMIFSTNSTRDPGYTLKLITGLDEEKYTSQNMEIPAATMAGFYITESGNIYELTPEADLSSKYFCIYDGMLSFVRTYVDGMYIQYADENGTTRYWQRINTLIFNNGKVTVSEDKDIRVGSHENLDGYFGTYKSYIACTNVTGAKVTSLLKWWPRYLDSKFSDGRYIKGHWVTTESGSYEVWYDIYASDGEKISTGPTGIFYGSSSQRNCPKIRFLVINDTKVIFTVDDLGENWIEEFYRAAVVTENDEGIVEVPLPLGKKNITPPDSADTTPTEDVVDFAADNLELGFNVKENVLDTANLTPELREQVNTIRLDSIVILNNKDYVSGKQNTGVTLEIFDEYDDSFGNAPVRFYSNGQYLCWYCDQPEKLKEGIYNINYQIGQLTICGVVKVIAPPTNNSATTVVF